MQPTHDMASLTLDTPAVRTPKCRQLPLELWTNIVSMITDSESLPTVWFSCRNTSRALRTATEYAFLNHLRNRAEIDFQKTCVPGIASSIFAKFAFERLHPDDSSIAIFKCAGYAEASLLHNMVAAAPFIDRSTLPRLTFLPSATAPLYLHHTMRDYIAEYPTTTIFGGHILKLGALTNDTELPRLRAFLSSNPTSSSGGTHYSLHLHVDWRAALARLLGEELVAQRRAATLLAADVAAHGRSHAPRRPPPSPVFPFFRTVHHSPPPPPPPPPPLRLLARMHVRADERAAFEARARRLRRWVLCSWPVPRHVSRLAEAWRLEGSPAEVGEWGVERMGRAWGRLYWGERMGRWAREMREAGWAVAVPLMRMRVECVGVWRGLVVRELGPEIGVWDGDEEDGDVGGDEDEDGDGDEDWDEDEDGDEEGGGDQDRNREMEMQWMAILSAALQEVYAEMTGGF